jgi:protein tyrosine phosphatase (PTP) superfamily phosphohydrolase (DUF442 family)
LPDWEIEGQLARSGRPGYTSGGTQVASAEVDRWVAEARSQGIRSIICLLGEDQLCLYASLPTDLVSYYRGAGLNVEHIPARDYQSPPLTDADLARVWCAYTTLAKPVLVHCSAGRDRTGAAIKHIRRQLSST